MKRIETIYVIFLTLNIICLNSLGLSRIDISQYKYSKPIPKISEYPDSNSSWYYTWGFNSFYQANKFIIDSENNIYLSGMVRDDRSNIYKMFIVKLNTSGQEQWNFTINVLYTHRCEGFSIDSEFNIYYLGISEMYPDPEWSLLKFNNSGSLLWNRTLIGHANCLYVDLFNKIYISGFYFNPYTDVFTGFIIKFNEMGLILWENSLISGTVSFPYAMMVDDLNNTYSVGIYTYGHSSWGPFHDAADIFFCTYNSTGDLISTEILYMGGYAISSYMFFDKYAHLYLIGTDDSHENSILFKYNYLGELKLRIDWHHDAVETYSELWSNIAFDSAGNIYCVGGNYYWTGNTNNGIYLVQFNITGKLELEGECIKYNHHLLRDFFIDSGNNIFFFGDCENGVFIIKNPILGAFSNPIFYLSEETIKIIIIFSMIFGFWILLGISFYLRTLPKSSSHH